MSKRSKKPEERANGLYAALPHSVLDSVAFMGASRPAQAFLCGTVARQLHGRNN